MVLTAAEAGCHGIYWNASQSVLQSDMSCAALATQNCPAPMPLIAVQWHTPSPLQLLSALQLQLRLQMRLQAHTLMQPWVA